jgi:hypothetical protein
MGIIRKALFSRRRRLFSHASQGRHILEFPDMRTKSASTGIYHALHVQPFWKHTTLVVQNFKNIFHPNVQPLVY